MSKDRKARTTKTAEELMAELANDPAYIQKMRERRERRAARSEHFRDVEAPVLAALRQSGFVGDSISDAVKNHAPLPAEFVDILLANLTASDDPQVVEWYVRWLAASAVEFDGRALATLYDGTKDPNLRWAILNTIACNKTRSIDDWIADRMQNADVKQTLKDLGYRK